MPGIPSQYCVKTKGHKPQPLSIVLFSVESGNEQMKIKDSETGYYYFYLCVIATTCMLWSKFAI